jgi:hypothetical protein
MGTDPRMYPPTIPTQLTIEGTMSYVPDLETEAANAGINHYNAVRDAVIDMRNKALTNDDFRDAVLLSHAIWWLTSLYDAAV